MADTQASQQKAKDEAAADAGHVLRYRVRHETPHPRRIRLEVPGWAGSSNIQGNGATPMPWHCQPFVEAATHGVELIFPYKVECRVKNEGGAIIFEYDEEQQGKNDPHGMTKLFDTFAPGHYGMNTGVDLLPPEGHLLRIEPHPRFFTDKTGQVPVAVPGHLQRFWPRYFFAVFRVPAPGEVHIFRPGEAYAQILVIPTRTALALEPMDDALAAERDIQDRQIDAFRYLMVRKFWKSDTGHYFDDLYKQLQRVYRRSGLAAVGEHLRRTQEKVLEARKKKE